jgi:hypothetical protein
MQQFALASVSPRSIAWLIKPDEWERLETIIKYNSAMLGGYYNVIIPLNDRNTLSEKYRRFVVDYDPDLIVLAPDMQLSEVEFLSKQFHPFYFISWNEVNKVVTLDPLSFTGQPGVTMFSAFRKILSEPKQFSNMLLAVADPVQPDASKLALVACGDIEPEELEIDSIDGTLEVDTTGYLETFLSYFLKQEYEPEIIKPHLKDGIILVPKRDRYALNSLLKEENRFPLSDAYQILITCFRLQNLFLYNKSFIGLTASYKTTGGTPERVNREAYPSMVILVSEHFNLDEAILFWNLRASEVYVSWLSFSDFETNSLEIGRWLESDRAILYTANGGFKVVFASN